MAISIPVIPPAWPEQKLDYPITPRENLLRVMSQQKPLWMPDMYADSQFFGSALNRDVGARLTDGVDWFGTFYKYEEAQGGTTPIPGLLNDISEWREKFIFPDLSAIDWASEKDKYTRNPNKAFFIRMSNGAFERLHESMGFEQALVDIITEPEECTAFFEAYIDYKIELFTRMNEVHHFDYVVCADDYGHMRAPFFSVETFKNTLLKPQRRYVEAVHKLGVKFIHHCCGVIEPFVPYFVEEIGYDGLEIQNLNNLKAINEKYGDRIHYNVKLEPELMFNDEATEEQVIAAVRELVDTHGAHVSKGAGAVADIRSTQEKLYYAAKKELFEYSRKQFGG